MQDHQEDDSPIQPNVWLHMLRVMNKTPYALVTDSDALLPKGSNADFMTHLKYLHDNRLCEALLSQAMNGKWSWGGAKITTRGIDHLRADGGLTAELGIVTVKLDADTIKALICSQIDEGTEGAEEKSKLKKAVKSLQGEALKTVTGELVKAGIRHMPTLSRLLDIASGL
ncbi:hypothetical protein [Komagataeibacter oboediens]|uniref:hypothetical protein n=1 Tax=Komagataeibacter oboediens TaxID=65958 RepID=UPI0012F4B5BB|nr:hypothetical protein [Komagataeibacter oboediens]